jgi:hypothetical protein
LTRQIEALVGAGVEHISLIGRWSIEERPPAPVFVDAIEEAGSLGALGIRNALADGRVRELDARQLSVIDPDGTMLMNVNTLADYDRACRAARADA